MKKLTLAMVIALTCAGALAACGDDDDVADTADALSEVCESQDAVVEDVEALITLDPAETTSEDLAAMVEDLEGDVETLKTARGDLEGQDVDNVQKAYDALVAELDDLDDVPLAEIEAETATAVGGAIETFQAAYDEAYANSSCETGDAETTETTEG